MAANEDMALAELAVKHLPALEAEMRRRDQYKIKRYFQDTGPYRRELYPKHMEFFAAGKLHRERLLIAANRVGKTEAGAFEATLHLTGEYPDWWIGRRFSEATKGWAAGTTSEKTKEIIQTKLLGPDNLRGTGTIPARSIHHIQAKGHGVPGSVGSIWVKHITGGLSVLQFKSYDQGREAFEGTEQHFAWLDEEPPQDVYTECVLRTMATGETFAGGVVFMTFTPLGGLTPLVLEFMPGGVLPDGGIVLEKPRSL